MFIIELIGYLGMILVIASFLFKNIKLIRIVNITGAILSSIYGFITKTYPTAFLNLTLIIINITMLIIYFKKEKKQK